jgi:hypothetical protein
MKSLLQSARKSFSTEPHTKAAYITAFATGVMAIISGFMCWTLRQNSRALQLAMDSLELQKQEFRLRARPYVDFKDFRLGGPCEMADGRGFPHSVQFTPFNISDIPATRVKVVCDVLLDGQSDFRTNVELGTLVRGQEVIAQAGLTREGYDAATSGTRTLTIRMDVTYAGMLGETLDEYEKTLLCHFAPLEGAFKCFSLEE